MINQLSLSVSTSMFGKNGVNEKNLSRLIKHGISYVELTIRKIFFSIDDEEPTKIIAGFVKKGLINVHSAHLYFEEDVSISAINTSSLALKEIFKCLELLKRFKTRFLVIHPSERIEENEREIRLQRCLDSLRILEDMAERDIKIALETMPPGSLLSSIDEIRYILDRTNPEGIGLCVDVNHLINENPSEIIKRFAERVLGFHFSDNDGLSEKHWYPTEGNINWSEVMQAIKAIGYNGPINFEFGESEESYLEEDMQKRCDIFHKLINLKVEAKVGLKP